MSYTIEVSLATKIPKLDMRLPQVKQLGCFVTMKVLLCVEMRQLFRVIIVSYFGHKNSETRYETSAGIKLGCFVTRKKSGMFQK